jgi:putative ABC transport system permease protein
MTRIRILISRFTGLFRKTEREQELEEEVRSHIAMLTEENLHKGMPPEEARYAALRSFGGVEQTKESYRDQRGLPSLESFFQDIRFGLRSLRKNRGFTAVAIITLALGIGATTAIFTVVNAVLLRPLPYPHPEQLVYVQQILGNFGLQDFVLSNQFAAWRDRNKTLSRVAAYISAQFNLTGGGAPERVKAGKATASFFSLLGVRPVAGRTFLAGDDSPGSLPVAILSEALWKRRYGGDPSVIGKGITLDGEDFTVVGVLPATFVIPDQYKSDYALWVPLVAKQKEVSVIRVIGRLKPAVALATARADLDTILQSTLPKGFPFKESVVLSNWHEQITGKFRLSLLLFLGAVGFLLLIACVNVANLMLSRAATRQKEIAVRLSVGAGRARVIRQLLTESAMLGLMGGLLGLVLARGATDLLMTFISSNLPTLEPIALDYRVLGFTLALAVLTGLLFGLAPAFQATKVSLNEVLKEAGRGVSEIQSGKVFRNLLIVCETALALVLLVGSGLLYRSFLSLRGVNPGYKSANILCLSIDLTLSKYPTPKDQARFFQQTIEAVKNLAGVQTVGASGGPPFGQWTSTVSGTVVAGQTDEQSTIAYAVVSPDYFRALGIPLSTGRYFDQGDHEGSISVSIVNEAFARRYYPNEICLGKRLQSWVKKNDKLTIVGMVGDVRNALDVPPAPEIFLPFAQAGVPYMTLLVRTGENPIRWAAAVRSQIASVDKEQPPHDVASMEELQANSLTSRRVNMLLLGAFAALGLILASVGIYGVVSYSVAQRTHEIGIRMAMGAERTDVMKFIVGQGIKVIAAGVGLGIIGALALTRFLTSMLYGVKPTDPLTFVAVSLLLALVAVLANYIPARRATKVDPLVALRYE